MNKINVICKTYVPEYKACSWPRTFQVRPMVGDMVEEVREAQEHFFSARKVLQIKTVTHCDGIIEIELVRP